MSHQSSNRFADRIALVTGAGSGIGRGVAIRLSAEGALVVLHGRTRAKLEETAGLTGSRCDVAPGDLTDPESNLALAERVIQRHGRLDILVNSAGIYSRGAASELAPEELDNVLAANFTGLVDLTRRLAPALLHGKPSGVVVNISSTLGLWPVAKTLAYSASKAAVVSATAVMAAEWGPQIRVNCICAGFVDTPMLRGRGQSESSVQSFLTAVAQRHPMRRVGQPDDIAAAVAFLVSDDASWVTGATLVVDGGFSVSGD